MDDDETASIFLRALIEQTPFLNLLSYHSNPVEALTAIEDPDLQLVFLDVNMPGLNGLELERMINDRKGGVTPRIIFISGFEQYALEGYKVEAIDYLLKPITYPDFINAAYKAKMLIENIGKAPVAMDYSENDYIFLRVEYELVKVYLKNILYIEGFKDYIKVYVAHTDGFIKSLSTMKSIEEKLPAHAFIRVHRSFIVSLDKIDSINSNVIKIGKALIPVSNQYKEAFKKFTDKWY